MKRLNKISVEETKGIAVDNEFDCADERVVQSKNDESVSPLLVPSDEVPLEPPCPPLAESCLDEEGI